MDILFFWVESVLFRPEGAEMIISLRENGYSLTRNDYSLREMVIRYAKRNKIHRCIFPGSDLFFTVVIDANSIFLIAIASLRID